jgi:hypothetical protein
MTEIAKLNNNLPSLSSFKKTEITFYGRELKLKSELNKLELELIEAINYLRINELENNELIDTVLIVVSNNLRALQSKMTGEDQALLVNDFIWELSNYFPNITIREFELIVTNGIRKKYDSEKVQTVGLSIVNFNYWAKCYLENKAKLNLRIENKLDKNYNLLPPAPVTKKSVLDILRNEYLVIQNRYSSLDKRKRAKIKFDEYWIENGNQVSAHYLFGQLQKFGLIDKTEADLELKRLNKNRVPKASIQFATLRMEAERIILCKLAIKLRNAKQKHDRDKK